MGNLSFGEFLHRSRRFCLESETDLCVCVCSEINELAVRRHFEECGSVEAVRLIRDQSSGMGKGFGYVLFQVCSTVRPGTHKSLFFTVTVEGSNQSVSFFPSCRAQTRCSWR